MNKVKIKLDHIGKFGKEVELFPILQQLFMKKGYDSADITHGPHEFGKDLVLRNNDPLEGCEKWTSVVVKNRKASNSDFENGGEIRRQIDTSFNHPYQYGGKQQLMNSVIVVVNGSVSNQAQSILLNGSDNRQFVNVIFWNRDKLSQEIEKHIKEEFLGEYEIKNNTYKIRQIESLKKLDDSKKLFGNLPFETIDNLFVSVRTSYRTMLIEEKKYKFNSPKIKKGNNIKDDDVSLILKSNKNIIIHGIPTSGKTLLLKRIGVAALESKNNYAAFYIKVSDCVINGKKIFEIVSEQYKLLSNGGILKMSDFQKVFILIDGIEESLKSDGLEKFFETVTNFHDSYNDETSLQIIIASRTVDVFEGVDKFVDYEQIELFPFNISQAMALAKKILPSQDKKAKNLIHALKSRQLSSALIRTPMAITLMAILYRDDEIDLEELPANITELYNKFTDYYLNRWDTTKGISLQYKYEELKNILAIIARHLQNSDLASIESEELRKFVKSVASEYPFEELSDIDAFLEKMKNAVEVIIYDKLTDSFSFINHSFQEYFASIYYDDSCEQELLNNYFNEDWEQTIIFYNGRNPKRDVFIKKSVDTIIPTELKQEYQFLLLTSKCLQAANLINRNTQKLVIKDLLIKFNKFYKQLLEHNFESKSGTTVVLNPIIFVLQLRSMLDRMFSTKHIDTEDLISVLSNFLIEEESENTEDAIKYLYARFLAFKTKDGEYLTMIDDIGNKDVIWQRFIYVDLKILNDDSVDDKYIKRLKRKQNKNRDLIMRKFQRTAIEVFYKPLE